MAMFSKIKDRVDGLVHEAKDKVTAVTGVDADKLIEAAGDFRHAAQDAAGGVSAVQAGRTHGADASAEQGASAAPSASAASAAPSVPADGGAQA
jgi:hypothetical protein